MESKHLWWHELPAPEIVRYAKEECDIALLPLGAIEQHGPHCPAGSDTYNAMGMAELVAQKTGVMLLPCFMYGSHPYHHWGMPGTLPLTYETHMGLIMDVVRGAAVAGYNKFILMSAHGQLSATTLAMQKLGLEGYFVLTVHWYGFVRDNMEIMETPMSHADETETSVALFLYPQYVDMSKARKDGGKPLIDRRFFVQPSVALKPGQIYNFEGTLARPEYKELDSGIIGDATLATREKGEEIVTKFVAHLSDLIVHIKERYPTGVKPPVD